MLTSNVAFCRNDFIRLHRPQKNYKTLKHVATLKLYLKLGC